MKTNLFKIGTIASAVALSLSASAMAQQVERNATQSTQVPSTAKQEEKVEKIQITGSRLRRSNFDAPSAVVTVGLEDIQDAGIGSLTDILLEQAPAVQASGLTTSTQLSVQNGGLSTINLRHLGVNRTLTLIDGRRAVANSYSGNYISLGTIPTGMVKKVDIITGGASAVYGSDAIAGVVNIITHDDKVGGSVSVKGGETHEGGGKEFTVDASYGLQFDDGRGYALVSSSWDREFGLYPTDRDQAMVGAYYQYRSDGKNYIHSEDGRVPYDSVTMDEWRYFSSYIPGGRYASYNPDTKRYDGNAFWYNEDGLQTDFERYKEGFNLVEYLALKIPRDRFNISSKVKYDLTDELFADFQIHYSKDEANYLSTYPGDYYAGADPIIDRETGEASQISFGRVPIENPFVPQEIFDAAGGKDIRWYRRFTELGRQETDQSRTTLRTSASLNGYLFDGDWEWQTYLSYGKFTQEQMHSNRINIVNFRSAVNAERLEDGTVQCVDEAARNAGCVPLNIFGIGAISPEAADYIRANPELETNIEQINFVGYMTGDLFEMPAGTATAAFGYEFRKDKQDLQVNEEHQFGGVTYPMVPSFSESSTVNEVFAEFAIPLLDKSSPVGSMITELSVRAADYDIPNVGGVVSYRAGLQWKPIEDVLVRLNYGKAQRAPTITEFASPPRGDFDSNVTDPCHEVTATSTAPGHAECRKDPTIANAIASSENGMYEQDSETVYSPNTGNPDIKEESADTYTLGISYSPSFIDGLDMSIDFYDITVDDVIASIDNEDILKECYVSSAGFGANNVRCNDIIRGDDGQIAQITQRVDNLASRETRGYDIAISYKHDISQYGNLQYRLDFTHINKFETTTNGFDGQIVNNYVGELESAIFDDTASASVTWRHDGWRVRWRANWKSSIVDSWDRVEAYQEDLAEGKEVEKPLYLEFGSFIRHNLSVSYKHELSNDQEVNIFGGVNNIFDNNGPFLPYVGDVDSARRGNTHWTYGGLVGRYIYLGASYKF